MNEKLKVAELLEEQKFMEKCKAADYEVETHKCNSGKS